MSKYPFKGMLNDFDSVYAAHLAGYGSVPSTLLSVSRYSGDDLRPWLDDLQLNRMRETERNYTYDRLEAITVEIDDDGEVLGEAFAYTAKVGCVNHSGSPGGFA